MPCGYIHYMRRCAEFSNAQSAVPKRLNEFWKNIERDFFLQWPDQAAKAISRSKLINNNEGPGLFQKKKQKKKTKATSPLLLMPMSHTEWVEAQKHNIYYWFNNNGLNKGCGGAGKVQTVKIMMPQSASRLSTECQIYSRSYYEDCVKASVETAIKKLGGLENIDAGQQIVTTNKCIANAYSKETDEKEVLKELNKAIINATDEVTPEQALMNPPGLPGILEESWRNPPGIQEFLGFLVNSWWIPGGFLGFRVNSWWIPGGFLVFLVFLVIPGIPGNSWWIPGGILMESGEIS
ncbi:hypothetical protein BYT27DRAFT_7219068 [Phlegmacium glaucopus]|nr:hypothetical protein BYT27DRAFT_7219068 [Phlegmacium glaucopus]